MDQEVKDARAKLAARFGQTQIGGKGRCLHLRWFTCGRFGTILGNEQAMRLHRPILIKLGGHFFRSCQNVQFDRVITMGFFACIGS